MRLYILSLAAGILVGVIYSLLHIRSPAPPRVALVGLLGMLIGEQLIPSGRRIVPAWLIRQLPSRPPDTGPPSTAEQKP